MTLDKVQDRGFVKYDAGIPVPVTYDTGIRCGSQ